MDNRYKELLLELGKVLKSENIKLNEEMKNYTTFKVGGPCDIMIFPTNEEEFINSIKEILKSKVPYFILGLGSNLLVKDGGIRGVVVNITKFNEIKVKGNVLKAKCGAKLKDVSNIAYENSLEGMCFACGIPGTIGGAITMNAGAYGGEISEVIKSVRVIDKEGNVLTINKDEMEFGYRSTIVMKKGYMVIDCELQLEFGDKEKIKEKIDDLTLKRETKQPLECASAGSTFKRPEGYFVGKLIEDLGLRGYTHKNAMISEKHCGFVINKSNATAEEILELIDIIKKKVYDKFKVQLELEVRVIGEDKREI